MNLLILNNRFFQRLLLTLSIGSAMAQVDFPREEYEYYMELINEINPRIYRILRECETKLKMPCIKKAIDEPKVHSGNDQTHGYPTMTIESLQDWPGTHQQKILKIYTDWYKDLIPINAEERYNFLKGLRAIDPTLYDTIIKVDPKGKNHIRRGDNGIGVTVSSIDGLPVFYIDSNVIDRPRNELLFSIAHELSHYVLGHNFEEYQLSHPILADEKIIEQTVKKGKKVAGLLPFEETFKKARQRIQENEADRMAVIEFGINIDDAIARLKSAAKEGLSQDKYRVTFQSTHPMGPARMKHMESLRVEVELNKIYGIQRKPINWEQLAQKYVEMYRKMRIEEIEKRIKIIETEMQREDLFILASNLNSLSNAAQRIGFVLK